MTATSPPPAAPSPSRGPRLEGLDLARCAALVGMVLVNFRVVLAPWAEPSGWRALPQLLEGRAAATFVVLAGIGLGLAGVRAERSAATTLRRALFLFALGLLNALVFQADILHFYAFYFALGAFCLRLRGRSLIALAAATVVVAEVLLVVLDYERGWNWLTLHYTDFWTPAGFVRHVFFNGWHPVFPWFAFLLIGIAVSRLDLGRRATALRLLAGGAVLAGLAEVTSSFLRARVDLGDPELVDALFGTTPIPPTPFYVLAGTGVALATVGACLLLAPVLARWRVLPMLAAAGRQTLTLYLAHILLGMGTMEALGMVGTRTTGTAVVATVVFCGIALPLAYLGSLRFRRGPVEGLMRRIVG